MMRKVSLLLLALGLAACENGGATRTVGITANGVVRGTVFFDANASRTLDGADAGIGGALVGLTLPGALDTLFRTTTGADGTFRFASVPVGSYAVVIDSNTLGDSLRTVASSATIVTVFPGDSVTFEASASFPIRTISEARGLAPGTRVFVRAIALHGRGIFSDTTLHVVDQTGAMRATRVRPSSVAVAAGDSVVLRARVAERLGQRVLDDVTVFVVAPTLIPAAPSITTAAAATGGSAGVLDAALVRLQNAQIIDTATVAGNLQLTLNDGSGAVTMVLDRAADVAFRPPLPAGLFAPTNRLDVAGVLVPTGAGAWRVKPRSTLDIIDR